MQKKERYYYYYYYLEAVVFAQKGLSALGSAPCWSHTENETFNFLSLIENKGNSFDGSLVFVASCEDVRVTLSATRRILSQLTGETLVK